MRKYSLEEVLGLQNNFSLAFMISKYGCSNKISLALFIFLNNSPLDCNIPIRSLIVLYSLLMVAINFSPLKKSRRKYPSAGKCMSSALVDFASLKGATFQFQRHNLMRPRY